MSLTLAQIPAFFANLLMALKLKEHPDGFTARNIPSYMADQMFHVEIGNITGSAANQIMHQFTVPVTLNVFFKDYRTPNLMRQAALEKAYEILRLVLQLKVRTSQGIKDIRPTSLTLNPTSTGNEKSAVLAVSFDVVLNYVFQGENL